MMGIYDGYLILSDIDGTLTARNGEVSEENLRAIRHFQSEGGRFALATGRKPDYIEHFPFRSNAPAITINGTLVASPEGEILLSLPMEEDFHDLLRYIVDAHPALRHAYRHGRVGGSEWSRRENGSDLSAILSGEPCHKFVFVSETESATLDLMADVQARWGERYEFDRSWPVGLEMHRKGSGKATCLEFLRTYLPDVHTVIAVGDYENDIPMLRQADIGCAVRNALPSVKEAADRIVVSNEEHAIAYIIEELIPEERGRSSWSTG